MWAKLQVEIPREPERVSWIGWSWIVWVRLPRNGVRNRNLYSDIGYGAPFRSIIVRSGVFDCFTCCYVIRCLCFVGYGIWGNLTGAFRNLRAYIKWRHGGSVKRFKHVLISLSLESLLCHLIAFLPSLPWSKNSEGINNLEWRPWCPIRQFISDISTIEECCGASRFWIFLQLSCCNDDPFRDLSISSRWR